METLAHALAFLMLAWLAALAATVIGKIFFGAERSPGLLRTIQSDGKKNEADPERMQLMVVSLGAILLYALEAIRSAAAGPVTSLPDADSLIVVLTGSNAVYLGGKLFRTNNGR